MARKISGEVLASDVRGGASYQELLKRYDVTPQTLDRFFEGLVKAGRVRPEQLPKDPARKQAVTCPKCGSAVVSLTDECGTCGVIPEKYESMRMRPVREAAERSAQETEQRSAPRTTGKPQKQQPMRPLTAGLLLVLVVLSIFYGLFTFLRKPDMTTQHQTRTVHHSATPISAVSLSAMYQENEISSDQAFKGSLLKVSGEVRAVAKDIVGNPYVSLRGSDKSFLGVKCTFPRQNASQLAGLRENQKITVEGVCKGRFGVVMIEDCHLVDY